MPSVDEPSTEQRAEPLKDESHVKTIAEQNQKPKPPLKPKPKLPPLHTKPVLSGSPINSPVSAPNSAVRPSVVQTNL